jgi:hypothetical protein
LTESGYYCLRDGKFNIYVLNKYNNILTQCIVIYKIMYIHIQRKYK